MNWRESRRGWAAALLLATTACASSDGGKPDDGFTRAVDRTSGGVGDAALTPLNDLNLRRTEVPDLLKAIRSPYEIIKVKTCGAIAEEVERLTVVLGPDSDAPRGPDDRLDQELGDEAADAALDTVSSTVTDFIPFRSLVRRATGATAHERRLRAAYDRGVQRRAYLKGVGAEMGCAPPAAPDPAAGLRRDGAEIDYRGAAQPSP